MRKWLLLGISSALVLGACDEERTYSAVREEEGDAGNGDASQMDSTNGDPGDSNGDPGKPDSMPLDVAGDTEQEQDTGPPPPLCIDCMCQCAEGPQMYGGCFEEGEPIPDEVLNCSADCSGICDETCPPVNCAQECPFGTWEGDWCPMCACAPPPVYAHTHEDVPVEHLRLDVEYGYFIGGIDRWTFEFMWRFDHPDWDDEEFTVRAPVRLQYLDFLPGEEPTTFWLDDPGPVEAWSAEYGSAWLDSELTVLGGFFTIRRVGEDFIGGVYLDLEGQDQDPSLQVGGPFLFEEACEGFGCL